MEEAVSCVTNVAKPWHNGGTNAEVSHHLNDEDDTEVDKENVAQGIDQNEIMY